MNSTPITHVNGVRDQNYSDPTPALRIEDTDYDAVLFTLKSVHYHDFQYADLRLQTLSSIRQILKSRGIQPVFIFTPINNVVFERLIQNNQNNLENFKRAQKDLSDILQEDFHDFSRHPDFTGFQNFYRNDPHHYYSKTGIEMIKRALKLSPSGKLL